MVLPLGLLERYRAAFGGYASTVSRLAETMTASPGPSSRVRSRWSPVCRPWRRSRSLPKDASTVGRRAQLLRWAAAWPGRYILEDDYDAQMSGEVPLLQKAAQGLLLEAADGAGVAAEGGKQ